MLALNTTSHCSSSRGGRRLQGPLREALEPRRSEAHHPAGFLGNDEDGTRLKSGAVQAFRKALFDAVWGYLSEEIMNMDRRKFRRGINFEHVTKQIMGKVVDKELRNKKRERDLMIRQSLKAKIKKYIHTYAKTAG